MAFDTKWGSVTALLHMDDTGLSDAKGNAVTLNGSVARSNTQSVFGGYSAQFSGGYLGIASTAFVASGDFFVEGWIRLDNLSNYRAIIRGDNSAYFDWGVATDGSVKVERVGTATIAATAAGLVAANTQTYVALGKFGNRWYLFVGDGTTANLEASASYAWVPGNPTTIGYSSASSSQYFVGFLDELRWSVECRWFDDFAQPGAAFAERLPEISGVTLDLNDEPVSRLVRLFRRDNAALVGMTISDAGTGAYSLSTEHNGEHFVLAHDTTGDPDFDKCVLAMYMDDTSLQDYFGHAVTRMGGTVRSAQGWAFSGYAAYFDGADNHLRVEHSSDLSLVSGDWTIEAFIYCTTLTAANQVVVNKDGLAGSSYAQYTVMINSSGKLYCSIGTGNGTGSVQAFTGTSTITLNAKKHIAFVKSGTSIMGFYDGTREFNTTQTATMADGEKPLLIGWEQNQPTANYFNGYVEIVRIHRGVAKYTGATYDVPTESEIRGPVGGAENIVVLDMMVPA